MKKYGNYMNVHCTIMYVYVWGFSCHTEKDYKWMFASYKLTDEALVCVRAWVWACVRVHLYDCATNNLEAYGFFWRFYEFFSVQLDLIKILMNANPKIKEVLIYKYMRICMYMYSTESSNRLRLLFGFVWNVLLDFHERCQPIWISIERI